MALEIAENFEVGAPIDAVWAFLNDPQNVVACMPGASLNRIVDESQFVGSVKLKIGAVSAQYQGTITYVERDYSTHTVKMLAAGNERGGGTVSGTILTRLEALTPGSTRIACQSSVDLTGKIVQVGRGMIEGISAQIIKMYVGNVRAMLEPVAAAAATAASGSAAAGQPAAATPPPARQESINIVAVVAKTLWEGVKGFFKRLFGKRSS